MARKAKPKTGPPSPAVQEWMRKKEAEERQARGESEPKDAPGAAPQSRAGAPGAPGVAPGTPAQRSTSPPPRSGGGGPGAPAAYGTPGYRRPVAAVETTDQSDAWKGILKVFLLLALGLAIAAPVYIFFKNANAAPQVGAQEIGQLRQGMTPEQVAAVLGKPQSRRDDPGTVRECKVDRIESAKHYEYFRKGTLMLVYNKDNKLIEGCLGETSQEYYDRKSGEAKALWQQYPDTGFIHQDVWRPNQD